MTNPYKNRTERFQREADDAGLYTSLSSLQESSRRIGERLYGWVEGHFIEMYPGGRAVDYSHRVRMNTSQAMLAATTAKRTKL